MNSVLLLSLLFIISSCSIKGYKPITESEKNKIVAPHIFADDFEKALYKTSINIYGNEITGLTLFKKTDSAIRVVSMSELGMKYFDFEFPLNQLTPTIVHYIMEPLNKKMLVSMLNRDFRLLFFPPDISKSSIKIGDEDEFKMLAKQNKLVYFFNLSGEITKIHKQRHVLPMKPIISLSGYTHPYPDTINICRGKIKFDFEVVN